MKIITSLHVYNFHLIISYLGQGVQIVRFEDFRNKFRHLNKQYPKELEIKTSLQEITTFNHQLLGVHNYEVKSFALGYPTNTSNLDNFWRQFKTSQLALDYENSDLYLLSDDYGIHEINIKNVSRPAEVKNIVPKTFEELGSPVVSNMITKDKRIYLSYRGFGAARIDNSFIGNKNETIYRSEDAQDVNILSNQKIIIVADGIDGLLFFYSNEEKPILKVKLVEGDFPQQIKLYMGNILIKGKNGLYIYYLNNRSLKKTWDGPLGALTTYYNYIFFSSKGQINLLTDSEKTNSYFELNNKENLDIKINKYLR